MSSGKGRLALLVLLMLGMASCVSTRKFHRELEQRDAKITSLESEIEANESRIVDAERRIDGHDEAIEETSATARDALERATEAGRLAKGKLVYEVVLSDDVCSFPVNGATLSLECKSALEDLALKLINEHEGVYLEIQGHTDSTGDADYNMALGLRRAEAVKRYLNEVGHIALHRMSTISYGETRPIADNATPEGRRQNRRVVIVVLE
jgi:outer membrane protein OmpA-like peptidoglycan-associated protein